MATAPATALLPHVDELVLEYLLFRGFTRSFQALAAERKRDRAKGFDVEQITGQLLGLVQTYHLEAILDAWNFLEARFFSRLDGSFTATIRQLEDSWLRLYLVNAIKSGHVDKAVDFFKLLADKLNAKNGKAGGDSWHRWFILPYVQHPESDPFFRPYFEKQWAESLVTSFRNFLSLVFRNMPLPKLLALQVARVDEPSLRLRLKTSQSECSRLRHHNAQSAERIRQLEDAGQKMFRMVETLVQHSFAEHFAATSEVSVWTDRIPEDDEGEEPPVVLKALNTLSSQLRDLRDVFGPAARHDTTYRDVALSSALQDPITVKLNAVAASSAASNDEGTVAILGLSSPSSSSQQSFESANSPAHQVRKKTLSPVLVDEVVMAEEPSGRGEEAICRYSHDGQRLVVACRGLQTIRVFDVDTVNHKAERELIQTDSPIVGVDWIAQSHCLVHALEDGTITVWDTETKARTFIISYNADERRPSLLACARSSAIGAVALVSSEADEAERIRIQFFAFEDQAIRVVSSVELPKPTDLRSLHWANDGSALAVAESDGRVSLLSPSEARSLGSWRLGTGDAPLASITFGSDNQSLLAVEASGDRVAEWRIADLLATVTAEVPPSKSYRLPSQLVPDRETTRRQIEIQTARFTFAVSSCASSTASYWTVFTRGIPDPILTTPVQVAGHIDALAWHPFANTLSTKTADGKLSTWKVSH